MNRYEIPDFPEAFGTPYEEAQACRSDCGLFNFSFVKRARLAGSKVTDLIEHIVKRRISGMQSGQIRYGFRSDDNGHLISDLTIWKFAEDAFEIMTGHGPDIEAFRQSSCEQVRDLSKNTSIFAVQGPNALNALKGVGSQRNSLNDLDYFEHRSVEICGVSGNIGRLGYTGEAGFELVLPIADSKHVWEALSAFVRPCGFAAADVLRIEAGFPLFWNDFVVPVTAAEAGLGRFVEQGTRQGHEPVVRICARAEADFSPALWRPDTPPGRPRKAGEVSVTSACVSPSAKGILLLGFARAEDLQSGMDFYDSSGNFKNLRAANLPFYDPGKQRPRQGWH